MKKNCPNCGAAIDKYFRKGPEAGSAECPYCNTMIEFDLLNDKWEQLSSGKYESVNLRFSAAFFEKLMNRRSVLKTLFGLLLFSSLVVVLWNEPSEKRSLYEREPIIHKKISDSVIPSGAAVKGKYSGLLQIVNCPEDRNRYGRFRDEGFRSSGALCNVNVKSGYRVWASPKWYIWSNNNYDINNKSGITLSDSSVNGKYSELLQVIECARDRENYGVFYDYGYWSGTRWCSQNVTSGYWVWVAPKWYIWKYKVQ